MTRGAFASLRLPLLLAALSLTTACANVDSHSKSTSNHVEPAQGIDPTLKAQAIGEVKAKRAKGQRVWCVPFARTASGVEIKGNAGTWWNSAAGVYARGDDPVPGSVMAFASTKKNPMGHVAVVSEVVSDREIRIDHANWERNKLSLGMVVVDVSAKGDWSSVKLESQPGTLGRAYPINGFIYPAAADVTG